MKLEAINLIFFNPPAQVLTDHEMSKQGHQTSNSKKDSHTCEKQDKWKSIVDFTTNLDWKGDIVTRQHRRT